MNNPAWVKYLKFLMSANGPCGGKRRAEGSAKNLYLVGSCFNLKTPYPVA